MLAWILLVAVSAPSPNPYSREVVYFPKSRGDQAIVYGSAEACHKAAALSTLGYQGVDEILQPEGLPKAGWPMPVIGMNGLVGMQSRCEAISPRMSHSELALLKVRLTENGWTSLAPVLGGSVLQEAFLEGTGHVAR
jgi:hypothetical protein